MITDVWFVKDINTAVDKMAAVSTSPVYYYEFSFSGPFGIIKKLLGAESLPGKFRLLATLNVIPKCVLHLNHQLKRQQDGAKQHS
jgi:hypothetical protein